MQIVSTGSSHGRYKGLPSLNIIFTRASFFSCFFVSFSSHTFSWACGSLRKPGSFSLLVHVLVCPITHSFLNGFQPNLVQHFPYVYSTSHSIFSLNNTLECVCDSLLHCKLISAITWTPTNDLHKLLVTHSILMHHSVLKVLKQLLA